MSAAHWRWVALLLGAGLTSCRSAKTPPASAGEVPPPAKASTAAPATIAIAPSAASATAPTVGSPEIDSLFREWEKKLPRPETMSESNGFTMICKRHGDATYNLLQATAQKLPVRRDSDVAALVPWARSGDDCIRQIALDAIIAKIGYAQNRLSIPGMHDPEHYHFHSILVSTKAYLDARVPGYDKKIFEGALIELSPKDFSLLHGKWKDSEARTKNFYPVVEIGPEKVRVTTKEKEPDPKFPDSTFTIKIKEVSVNDQAQFVVTGSPSQTAGRKYSFWPVSRGIVWFNNGLIRGHGRWEKLLKVN